MFWRTSAGMPLDGWNTKPPSSFSCPAAWPSSCVLGSGDHLEERALDGLLDPGAHDGSAGAVAEHGLHDERVGAGLVGRCKESDAR
jgi:hypothetical protein